jgi:hypothetical protein
VIMCSIEVVDERPLGCESTSALLKRATETCFLRTGAQSSPQPSGQLGASE